MLGSLHVLPSGALGKEGLSTSLGALTPRDTCLVLSWRQVPGAGEELQNLVGSGCVPPSHRARRTLRQEAAEGPGDVSSLSLKYFMFYAWQVEVYSGPTFKKLGSESELMTLWVQIPFLAGHLGRTWECSLLVTTNPRCLHPVLCHGDVRRSK